MSNISNYFLFRLACPTRSTAWSRDSPLTWQQTQLWQTQPQQQTLHSCLWRRRPTRPRQLRHCSSRRRPDQPRRLRPSSRDSANFTLALLSSPPRRQPTPCRRRTSRPRQSRPYWPPTRMPLLPQLLRPAAPLRPTRSSSRWPAAPTSTSSKPPLPPRCFSSR